MVGRNSAGGSASHPEGGLALGMVGVGFRQLPGGGGWISPLAAPLLKHPAYSARGAGWLADCSGSTLSWRARSALMISNTLTTFCTPAVLRATSVAAAASLSVTSPSK